jgi:hypothetical protein
MEKKIRIVRLQFSFFLMKYGEGTVVSEGTAVSNTRFETEKIQILNSKIPKKTEKSVDFQEVRGVFPAEIERTDVRRARQSRFSKSLMRYSRKIS